MDKNFTPYFFQYTYFEGREHTSFTNLEFSFEYDSWLSMKINQLIESTPELPDEIIKTILKKANVC